MTELETIEEMQQRIKENPDAVLAELNTVCLNCCDGCRKHKLCWEYMTRPIDRELTSDVTT